MPELPEVETVRRGLAPALEGRRLVRVEARRPDLRFPLPDGFVQRLTGARVERLDRRAKYLLAPLDRGDTLVMHLGMTGRFDVVAADGRAIRPGEFYETVAESPKHEHVVFHTDEGARVAYSDPRRFGFMDLIATEAVAEHPWFRGMGPEPLGPEFTAETLAAAFAGRKQGPKTLLLDQRIVAGLGNIYVCEALWRAHISPFKPAGGVARKRLGPLAEAIRAVLTEAIAAGGSTLRDFAAADGALGYFQHRFCVYDREGEACLTPGCGGVVARLVQAGRSTFFCPVCQGSYILGKAMTNAHDSSGQAGATTELEITPDRWWEAYRRLVAYDPEGDDPYSVVRSILEAMLPALRLAPRRPM